jgi:hypothetical protein
MYVLINKLIWLFSFLSIATFSICTEVTNKKINKKYSIQEKYKKKQKKINSIIQKM